MKKLNIMAIVLTLAGALTASGCANTEVGNEAVEASAAPLVAASDAQHADGLAAKALGAAHEMIAGVGAPGAYTLGEAFPVFVVQPGSAEAAAQSRSLDDAGRLYPLVENGKTVGTLRMRKVSGSWVPDMIGVGGEEIARVIAARDKLRHQRSADADSYGIVHVPRLREQYLVHGEQASLFLTSLKPGDSLTPRPASGVLVDISVREKTAPQVD